MRDTDNSLRETGTAVTLLDLMGGDLTVANAARCSFGKRKETFDEQDARLIAFLAREGHWSPFSHPQLSFHVLVPVYVARQLWKSHVGCSGGDAGTSCAWNEASRRYIDSDPAVVVPEAWRLRAPDKKQGSSGEAIVRWPGDPHAGRDPPTISASVRSAAAYCLGLYRDMVAHGIAPEMARMVLPLSVSTEFWWTGSLYFFARVCRLRQAPDAQAETREVAHAIAAVAGRYFPVSWQALTAPGVRALD